MWQFIHERLWFFKKKLQQDDGFINQDSRISQISYPRTDTIENSYPDTSAIENESCIEDTDCESDNSGSSD